jgi:hypothetical protein
MEIKNGTLEIVSRGFEHQAEFKQCLLKDASNNIFRFSIGNKLHTAVSISS